MSFNVISGDLHDLLSKPSKHAAKYICDAESVANQIHMMQKILVMQKVLPITCTQLGE